ncbi:MAG: sigma-70 family RNA polymerase sigma factor [Bacteroidetes bacterium]|nr:sigma-70 family RNA polymerase sigma factor [Bacteroidota bacterium]
MFNKISLSDEAIIESIRSGNQKMLVLLYKRNYPIIRGHILKNSGFEADVEDVLQETLVALWQKLSDKNFTLTAKLDTFIFAIAKNHWLTNLHKKRFTVLHDGSIEIKDTISVGVNEEMLSKLAVYMKQLSEVCRNILHFYYFDDLSMEDIAQRMNFANADTVKTKKYQCKKKLEEMVKQHHSLQDFL